MDIKIVFKANTCVTTTYIKKWNVAIPLEVPCALPDYHLLPRPVCFYGNYFLVFFLHGFTTSVCILGRSSSFSLCWTLYWNLVCTLLPCFCASPSWFGLVLLLFLVFFNLVFSCFILLHVTGSFIFMAALYSGVWTCGSFSTYSAVVLYPKKPIISWKWLQVKMHWIHWTSWA